MKRLVLLTVLLGVAVGVSATVFYQINWQQGEESYEVLVYGQVNRVYLNYDVAWRGGPITIDFPPDVARVVAAHLIAAADDIEGQPAQYEYR